MKKPGIKNILKALLIAIAAYWLVTTIAKLPFLGDLFASKKVEIDQTPILIKEIRSIAELVTITSLDEVVVDSLVYNRRAAFFDAVRVVTPLVFLPSPQKQLVLIGRGKVLAGIDLQQLDTSHLFINADTISLALPPAKILEAIINPSDFETFEERGTWNDKEVTLVKLKARRKMIDRALQQGILERANKKAIAIMENFLRNAGYKKVQVYIR